MKKILGLFLLIGLLAACDDGDLIVTTFDFDEDTKLSLCGDSLTKVIYAVNTDPNESISFKFQSDDFDGTFDSLNAPEPKEILINAENKIIYRIYDGELTGSNYFCVEVPPSSPTVAEEYETTTGGKVILVMSVIEQDDHDGVEAAQEDINGNGVLDDDDTDADGIPNFIDPDDDNDNVTTLTEIGGEDAVPQNFPDTDSDGTPDYLDEDDDNDGVLSRNEDLNQNLNLLDDDSDGDGIDNYLDADSAMEVIVDEYREYTITRTFRTRVIAEDITLNEKGGEESIRLETLVLGHLDVQAQKVLTGDP